MSQILLERTRRFYSLNTYCLNHLKVSKTFPIPGLWGNNPDGLIRWQLTQLVLTTAICYKNDTSHAISDFFLHFSLFHSCGILVSDGDVNVLLMFRNKAQLWRDHPLSAETFMTLNFHTL